MIFAAAILLILIPVALTLGLRQKDLPDAPPVSPTAHLEQRKAQIYENLRDLQFEFRVGKLSDTDYQSTKLSLQKQLAGVMAEIESITNSGPRPPVQTAAAATAAAPVPSAAPSAAVFEAIACPHCGATFDKPMKFCGECGKAIA